MASITKLVPPANSFDPEILQILGTAYDRGIAKNGYAPALNCEVIAGRIIDAGMKGECDIDALCKIALGRL